MQAAREDCPMCNSKLLHSSRLNKLCPLITVGKLSYIEGICSKKQDHTYYQISSIYSELLLEKISFPLNGFEAEINYVQHLTRIRFYHTKKNDYREIELKNQLLVPNYPSADNVLSKIKTLSLFI